ncbi:MAG: membrane protein insertion efficiency factor YidD [Pseudonocardia sp.]
MNPGPSPLARVLLGLLAGYRRWISPALPPTCRFYPTCSAYAVTAVRTHGAVWGFWLTARRLLRCGPWHPGGVDHVPPRGERRSITGSVEDHEEQAPC